MKDKGISRNIGKGQSRPSEGGPGLGNVQRMAVGGENRGERRRRSHQPEAGKPNEERHHQSNHLLLVRWSMLFAVLALVILSLFVMFWLMPYLNESKEAAKTDRKVLSVIEEPENKIPGEAEAVSLVKKAVAVTDANDVEKFIQIDSTAPEEVVGFLNKVKREEGEIARYDWLPRLDTSREDIIGVAVTFKKEDGAPRNRLALLVPDEDGRWKMDFAAFSRSTTPSWSDFMDRKADSAVVRVYVARDEYFNGSFKEQDGWRCYGIASPDMPELYYGYCLAGGPQDKVLAALLADKKGARATIGLERVEGASDRQFRIKRVLAEDWAIRDTPADEVVK